MSGLTPFVSQDLAANLNGLHGFLRSLITLGHYKVLHKGSFRQNFQHGGNILYLQLTYAILRLLAS